ncbi:hypothetical protein Tco_1221138 [Tanacetum coccineum]
MYKINSRPAQTRTQQLPQDIRKTNKCVSFSTGVIPTTSVSRPQLKSTQLEDMVMQNNSQVKTKEVEDHRRNFKFSKNKTSVIACNDSLNVKTSNVKFVCVTCGKCVVNDNYDLCVLNYINGVNSRTKKLIVVLIKLKLNDPTQGILDIGGIFLYNTPNKAFKILEDKVLLKLDFSDDPHMSPEPKTVISVGGSNIHSYHAILSELFEALTTKIDSEFLIIGGELNEMRDGRRDNYASQIYMKDNTPMCEPYEANYV